MKRALILMGILISSVLVFAEKNDSIGTKVKDGKVYILHKVEKGQGLYTISKKYNVPLRDIMDANPGAGDVIQIDQIIYVPTKLPVVMEEPVVEDFFEKNKNNPANPEPDAGNDNKQVSDFVRYHTVVKGETLFSISQKYNTTVAVIMDLNDLESTTISEGQRMLVPGSKKTVEVPNQSSDLVDNDLEEIKEDMDMPTDSSPSETITEDEGYTVKIIKLDDYNLEKVEEKGKAVVNSEDLPEDKHFAYHCNASKGTVIMVTNPKTNKTIFVKVIGNFDRASSSDEIIRLSDFSATSIGLTGKDVVELSYAR
ncbi:LysM peptidoglycan-binding domain-containing protein [bacterium]|nr:LysM peptidoglycan-binding domain-containing protein [bacterium]